MSSTTKELKSIQFDPASDTTLEFHVHLPPNLEHTAPRDAIAVKVDAVINGEPLPPEKIDRSIPYNLSPQHVEIASLLEDWCQGPPLFGMLQLTRERLKSLLSPLTDQPNVFRFDLGTDPLQWADGGLPGVHEFLVIEEDTPPPSAPKKVILEQKVDDEPITPPSVDGSTQFLAITLPSKNSPYYGTILDILNECQFKLEPLNRKWWLRDERRTLNFLAKYWNNLKNEWNASFSDNFLKRTQSLNVASVKCTTSTQLDVNLTLKTPGVSADVARDALTQGQYFAKAPNGSITLIPPSLLDKFAQAQRDITGEISDLPPTAKFTHRLRTVDLPYAQDIVDDLVGSNFQPPQNWEARSRALKEVAHLKMPSLPEKLHGTLRGYQRIGTAWLNHIYIHQLGGILADEMGLGKTLQALAFIKSVTQKNLPPSLVVCPASLVENWRRESDKFTPSLKVYCHHGYNRAVSLEDYENHDIIITSYGTLRSDIEFFEKVEFTSVIADEAQHIKNRRTQNSKSLRRLNAKGRILLTGTPVENSLDDLRSLFEFLMPGYITPAPSSLKREEKEWYDDRLRAQVAPYILRRSKELVAPELPEKIEKVLFCEMGPEQLTIYRQLEEKTRKAIFELEMSGASDGKIRFAALTQLLRLRQICADPRILDDTVAPEHSAKLRALRELVQECIDGGHRMLVFSQFTSVLALIKQDLEAQGLKYCYLDGKTRNRLNVCDKFNNDDSIPIFLISLKAGGVGLNLTGADTVIHYDPWWNPAVEAQATDRTHRIGQTRVVTSIKLIMSNTVEERVLELQQTKAHLLKDILDSSDAANTTIGLDDIKALIA